MKKKVCIQLLLVVTALVLEIIPYGVALYFRPHLDEQARRSLFSFFSLMPVGYANFGCFAAALFTVVLLILSLCYIRWQGKAMLGWIRVISGLAVVSLSASLCVFGLESCSWVGLCVEILLVLLFGISLFSKAKVEQMPCYLKD